MREGTNKAPSKLRADEGPASPGAGRLFGPASLRLFPTHLVSILISNLTSSLSTDSATLQSRPGSACTCDSLLCILTALAHPLTPLQNSVRRPPHPEKLPLG